MRCPKCGIEGIETGDVFCRHCGISVVQTPVPETAAGMTEKKAAAEKGANKGLEKFGVAIFVVAWFIATIVAFSMGLPEFSGSVLPWLSGAMMLVGLVMLFIGFELRHAE